MNKQRYTPDMIVSIIQLKRQGKSNGAIAKIFTQKYRTEVTRNAIIGKVDRLRKQGYGL